MQPEVIFCGLITSKKGCKPLTQNLEPVLNVPRPTVNELRLFLEMANYYNPYIPRVASIAVPLQNLLRKNVIWEWSRDCEVFKT